MASQAVFWDRDNTLIEDPGYISDPKQVRLLPGAADALSCLANAGFQNIIVTNQSGIARGLLTEAQLEKIHDRLRKLLADQGGAIDAIYYCPYLDSEEATVPEYRQDSDLRKPKPGMFAKAALEHNIELTASWCIGDSLRDAQAGKAAGCRTIVVADNSSTNEIKPNKCDVDFVVESLGKAVETVLAYTTDTSGDRPNTAKNALSTSPSAKSSTAGDSAHVLHEILAFLRMVDKRSQAEDFSLTRLTGAVLQIIALAALIWAIFAMLRNEELGVQIVRLLFGLLLQTLALTFFVLSGKK